MRRDRQPCSLNEAFAEFKEHIIKFRTSIVNFLFILDMQGSTLRSRAFGGVSIALWIILAVRTNNDWLTKLGESIRFIFALGKLPDNPLLDFIFLAIRAFFALPVLRIFAILLAPMLIAYRAAYLYLADIYELEDETIAARFVWQASLGTTYDEIKIKEGQIAREDLNSPIVKIGGPGRIKADLYSAALFEKPNGRPRVVGPKVAKPKEKSALKKIFEKIIGIIFKKPSGTVIEAFEHLRYTKDLRDEILEPFDVSARTREGIKVTAKDVRMVFSIWRGNPTEDELKTIYPYSKRAISHFFYSKTSKVTSLTIPFIGANAFGTSTPTPMRGIVQSELSNFISSNSLSDFLTAVGKPEKEELLERAKSYQEEKDLIDRIEGKSKDPSGDKFEAPDFIERDQINPLFYEFAEEFSANNRKKGVSLYWLGTGTWITPDPEIIEKNMEAFELSKRNKKDGAEKKLSEAESKEKCEELLRLIRKVPLGTTRSVHTSNLYTETVIKEMLQDYTKIIRDAINLLDIHETDTPKKDFFQAVRRISQTAHWVGTGNENQNKASSNPYNERPPVG